MMVHIVVRLGLLKNWYAYHKIKLVNEKGKGEQYGVVGID
jgi:hypothetical protein